MPRFRAPMPNALCGPLTGESVRTVIAEMIRPAHFFAAENFALEWRHSESEELAWEIFQGRLLDPAHTRQRRSFESWNIHHASEPAEPLLSMKLDAAAGQLHIVRGLDSYVWEGYDAGGNVIQSRERRKWVQELVGTVRLDRFADPDELRDELACQLFQAVVGTSRLPLASVETPLPSFSFGQLFYCYRPTAVADSLSPRSWRELLADMLTPVVNRREQARLLETFLHAAPFAELPDAGGVLVSRFSEIGRKPADLLAGLRTLFNEVSLSPYTDLVEKTLALLRRLEERGHFPTAQVIDFLSFLLRHIGRHLTAYDLVLFHHRGANYPDALLLDEVLKEYLAIVERRSELFADTENDDAGERQGKRIRRRALRQGWLLRRRYEGHAVPDLPTSPGENRRVLPPSHPRVAEDQIEQPSRRTRRLYADDPILARLGPRAAELLRQSLLDVEHPDEWREMGMAVFLDRPLGVGKTAGEPDATLLLSAEAFSVSMARQRLLALAGDVGMPAEDAEFQRLLAGSAVQGLALEAIGAAVRPGTVSLSDARRAAADFVFLRSTRSSVRALLDQYEFTSLARHFHIEDMLDGSNLLIARSVMGMGLTIHDSRLRPRLELEAALGNGFENRAGFEYPAGGLLAVRVWEAVGGELRQALDRKDDPIRIPPR